MTRVALDGALLEVLPGQQSQHKAVEVLVPIIGVAVEPVETAIAPISEGHDVTPTDGKSPEELLLYWQYIAENLAWNYGGRTQHDDLAQVGKFAIWRAAKRFDPDYGVDFPVFATTSVKGALRQELRDRGRLVRIPRQIYHDYPKVMQAFEQLKLALSVSNVPAVAAHLEIDEDKVKDVLTLDFARRQKDMSWGDCAEAIKARTCFEPPEISAVDMDLLLEGLSSRESQAIRLRFGIPEGVERTQTEIAEAIGVSQMHVSRILRQALQKLREMLEEE